MDSGKSQGTEKQVSLQRIFENAVEHVKATRKKQLAQLDAGIQEHGVTAPPSTDSVMRVIRREVEVRLDDDIALLELMGNLATTVDLVFEIVRPTTAMTLKHDETYRELQAILNRISGSANKELPYVH